MYKILMSIIVVIVVVFSVLVGGFLLWQNFAGDHKEEISLVSVEGIKKIAELATIEYYLSAYEHRREYAKTDPLKWWPKEYMVFVKGNVVGSVDLDKAVVGINQRSKHVNIVFQKDAIKIHFPEIKPGDIVLLKCQDLFNPIHPKDWESAVKTAQKTILKIAEENDIQSKTANEAAVLLTGYLNSFGYTSKVTFSDDDLVKSSVSPPLGGR